MEEKFEKIVSFLRGEESQTKTISELERTLEEYGRDLLRDLLQQHVDNRGLVEVGDAVEGSDGLQRTHKRVTRKVLKTIFGPIQVERLSYSGRGLSSLIPKDAQLNIPRISHSYELQRRIVEEAIQCSYEDAVQRIEARTGQKIPKQQVERITVKSAIDFEDFYQKKYLQYSTQEHDTIVMSFTVKTITIVENKTQVSKRPITVATISTAKRPSYTTDNINTLFDREITKPYEQVYVKTFIDATKDPKVVFKDMIAYADLLKNKQALSSILIVAGDEKYFEPLLAQLRREDRPNTLIIYDLNTVARHIWQAAEKIFDHADLGADSWIKSRIVSILQGKSSQVAAALKRAATKLGVSKSYQEVLDQCADYLIRNAKNLEYEKCCQQGYPLAMETVKVLGSTKTKDRITLSGARWMVESVEAMLKILTVTSRRDMDAYWLFHESKERIRNHEDKYSDFEFVEK